MDYPVVDSDGELVEVRSSSSISMLLASVPPGRHVLVAAVPDVPSWWDFERLEWVRRPPAPSSAFVWQSASKSWVDPRPMDRVKMDSWSAVRSRRDAVVAAPISVDGLVFDADGSSAVEIRLRALEAASAPPGWSVEFTLADNSVATVSALQMIAAASALTARADAVRGAATSARDAIDAASTPADAEAAVERFMSLYR